MKRACLLIALGILVQPPGVAAQQNGGQQIVNGDAAFLFAYRTHEGKRADFEAGYSRHLDWHRERGDSLPWLAWTVVSGPGMGLFVDGTFGISFAAFDERVDPAGDAAHAAANVTAFADPVYREVYRLRTDLSRSTRLETGRAGAMQKVVWLRLDPGGSETLERVLRAGANRSPAALDLSVYERVAGGQQPGFLLVVQFDAWADLAPVDADPTPAILQALGSAVASAESEVWLYRPDLTHIPR